MKHKKLLSALFLAVLVPWGMSARADFSFSYNGHLYTLITNAANWDQAHTNAMALNGTLARIDDAVENEVILTNLLNRGITNRAADGGNAIYVWIGGREITEGNYAWLSRGGTTNFYWVGGKTGSATNGLYNNWGRGTLGAAGPEPDNSGGTQNRSGFALQAWPTNNTTKIGQPGQWNDINGADRLSYLVEQAPPNAPTNVRATVTGVTTCTLQWDDASDNETFFLVYYRQGTGGQFSYLGYLFANTTSVPLNGFTEGDTFQFIVSAYNNLGETASTVASVTLPGVSSRAFHPAVVGQAFAYTITASSNGGAPDAFGFTGALPDGLSYNTNAHQITGVPSQGGVFTSTMSVHYPAWGTLTKTLTLRVIHPPGPPVATVQIPKQTLAPGGAALAVPLNTFFADRDTEKAVRFVTTMGTFDLALYATAAPQSVTNFLGYVNRRDYATSVVHRADQGFLIQCGGFKPAPPNFAGIPATASPTNEPGIQHVRGTVALAKQGGQPNSASTDWFINLQDNSLELDDQNEGFAAFGRVCGSGMTVADAIESLPRRDYTVLVDGSSRTVTDWPMNTLPPAPPTMDQSKLVLVNSATQIEPLSYSLTGNTVNSLVNASIQGTSLVLTPTNRFGGTTILTVTATDLDGNSVSQEVTVEVATAYSAWLSSFSLAGAGSLPGVDGDGDLFVNAVEFALGGSPGTPDRASTAASGTQVGLTNQTFGALIFKMRKDLAGAVLEMKASSSLDPGSWQTVWTSADLAGPQVVQKLDQGTHWLLTVRDDMPLPSGGVPRFLRLFVVVPQ